MTWKLIIIIISCRCNETEKEMIDKCTVEHTLTIVTVHTAHNKFDILFYWECFIIPQILEMLKNFNPFNTKKHIWTWLTI